MNLDDFHYRLKIYYQKNDETHAHKNTIHRYGTLEKKNISPSFSYENI